MLVLTLLPLPHHSPGKPALLAVPPQQQPPVAWTSGPAGRRGSGAQPHPAIFPRSSGSYCWRILLEIKVWMLSVLLTTGVFLLSGPFS